MDSVAVQANASMDSLQKKETAKDIDTYVDESGDEEGKDKAADRSLPSNRTFTGGKNNANGGRYSKTISNQTVLSTTDKEARVSVKPGKPAG